MAVVVKVVVEVDVDVVEVDCERNGRKPRSNEGKLTSADGEVAMDEVAMDEVAMDDVDVGVVVVDDDVDRNGSERCVDVDVDEPILFLFAEVGREEGVNFSYLAFMDCHE
ncbi:hypothetical protein OS493_012354 [Desmophyllum pertusum]|uniref:Uncharacterized protein n=1 Tax=Desmophyllum pertusum TaxID=174260 RepID=A0A9X0D4A3_9CNID|nr:hypothetical protein OS493_012354 [Desmophyllum pertusum]